MSNQLWWLSFVFGDAHSSAVESPMVASPWFLSLQALVCALVVAKLASAPGGSFLVSVLRSIPASAPIVSILKRTCTS
jgi:hypothetical protein